MILNFTHANHARDWRCCYNYTKDSQYCRTIYLQQMRKDDPDSKRECIIFELPSKIYIEINKSHYTKRNKECNITVNSKEVALGDHLNATCQTQKQNSKLKWHMETNSEGDPFRSSTSDNERNGEAAVEKIPSKWLWSGCASVVVAIGIIATVVRMCSRKKEKATREVHQETELIYADLALEPPRSVEVRGDERANYAEIVGVLKS
ncbi:hypothetical protein EVAR_99908_1 [Eumeta japonica]|uniref:Uncharacterized protein n=1 Tax=Eumeta variegata TaxID=151549 RepID=A0A4C1ZX46_EUMVA|nr:hypothetical protein EVAR_99908_1 [Eumeta japonica]